MSARGGVSGLVDELVRAERPFIVPLVRIVLCLWLAFLRLPGEVHTFLGARTRPWQLLHAPMVEALGLPWPPPAWALTWLSPLMVALALLAALGVLTRLSLLALAGLWLWIGAVSSGWGFFNHTPALAEQVLIALVVLPGTTAYSVDRLVLAAWRKRRHGTAMELAPAVPRFGERLLLLGVGVVYCASGLAKLRWGAVSWLDGTTLAWYLRGVQEQMWFGPDSVSDVAEHLRFKDGVGISGYVYLGGQRWVRPLAEVPGLPALLSWGTVVLEAGAPFFLLARPWIRGAFCLSAIVFHVLVVVMVGPGFVLWMIVVACMFPWREALGWLHQRWARRR